MTDTPPPAAPEPTPPPAYSPTPGAPAPVGAKKTLSLVAFILGIVSVVFSWLIAGLGLIAGIVGLILALLARSREPGAPGWMKVLGLVLSIVGIVLAIIAIIVTVVAVGNAINQVNSGN